ncbi:MAG: UDP-3-O-acyl-N-acetylglucosamine deacetylase [Victivallaceae bacterium]|nr:UDP-3-O-acyl-N-acetylglucosamine deacetylase [Victivallaceae bacterium]
MEKQRTLASEGVLSGIALHTGARASLRMLPAPENTGIVFRRVDLPGKPEIRASVANVVDVQRGTTIASGKVAVYTIEHIMSSLHANFVDNCIVEMNGPEPPICDGSGIAFFETIRAAGVAEQNAEARFFTPPRPLRVEKGGTRIVIFPNPDALNISCVTSFRGCPFDPQFFEFTLATDAYFAEIAPGRTFVDYNDLRMLIGAGLCKGGSLDAAAIIYNGAIICKEKLRFNNEIVRHKILDLIGDLFLAGCRIRGDVIAIRPGHPSNVALAGLLTQEIAENK